MTLSQLRALAKERGLGSVASKRKADLILLLKASDTQRSAPVAADQKNTGRFRNQTDGDRSGNSSSAADNDISPSAKRSMSDSGQPDKKTNNRSNHGAAGQSGKPSRTNRQPHRPAEHSEQRQDESSGHESVKNSIHDMLRGDDCRSASGVLEIMEGYGFLRVSNYFSGPNDVYVSIAQIRRFDLKQGDFIEGRTRPRREGDKYDALLFIDRVNGIDPENIVPRINYEDLIPIFPNERYTLETPGKLNDLSVRLIDLIAPIGKGQRAMIVSQPKAGKTTLLKQIANGISENYPETHLIVLLIDERPEEVTDMRRFYQRRSSRIHF